MNAAVNIMDWSRFTVEEWFKQYGAYIQTCRMKSGNEPDSLGVNQIYWLICENNKGVASRKDQIRCEINDFEAEEVRKLILKVNLSKSMCASAKAAVQLFIEKTCVDCLIEKWKMSLNWEEMH